MLPIRLSELPEAPLDVSQSGIFPVSDIPNDITYKLSLQQIPSLSANQNIKIKTSSYTITKNDYNTILYFNNVDNDTAILTIPNNNSKRIQPGYSIRIIRYNTGNVHIVPSDSVQIYSDSGFYLKNRYSLSTLTKITDNSWILQGDLTTEPNTGTPQVCYTISGSIISNINGRYQYYGLDPQNNPVYKHLSTEYYILWYNNCWLISNTSDGSDAWHNYYTHSCSGVKDLFPKGSWDQFCVGDYSFESIMANEATC
jgi:hypothetical protein